MPTARRTMRHPRPTSTHGTRPSAELCTSRHIAPEASPIDRRNHGGTAQIPRFDGENLASEFAGTFILILFGVGVVATGRRGRYRRPRLDRAGRGGSASSSACTSQARSVVAHINPAVTRCPRCVPRISRGARSARTRWRKPRARSSPAFWCAGTTPRLLGQGRPRAHHQDSGRLLDTARQRSAARARVGRLPRPGHRHRNPAVPRRRDHRRRNTAPAPTSRPSSSACSSWRSAWRGAATPATRSTRRVTSVPRFASFLHRLSARHFETSTGISTSGCRSSRPIDRRHRSASAFTTS